MKKALVIIVIAALVAVITVCINFPVNKNWETKLKNVSEFIMKSDTNVGEIEHLFEYGEVQTSWHWKRIFRISNPEEKEYFREKILEYTEKKFSKMTKDQILSQVVLSDGTHPVGVIQIRWIRKADPKGKTFLGHDVLSYKEVPK